MRGDEVCMSLPTKGGKAGKADMMMCSESTVASPAHDKALAPFMCEGFLYHGMSPCSGRKATKPVDLVCTDDPIMLILTCKAVIGSILSLEREAFDIDTLCASDSLLGERAYQCFWMNPLLRKGAALLDERIRRDCW